MPARWRGDGVGVASATRLLRGNLEGAMMQILHAESEPLLSIARELFAEYARSIAGVAACSLQHQRFDDELATLPGLYAPPLGCILVAQSALVSPPSGRGRGQGVRTALGAQSPVPSRAGCIALRPLPSPSPGVCELKRMYVRPAFRGTGLGRALAHALLAFARAAGYHTIKLDTSTTMHAAIGLYTALGFKPCERYNDDPMGDTLWFDLRL